MGVAGFAQIAVQHLGSYTELVGLAATEYKASFRRRILLGGLAIVLAFATLLAAWTTGLALLWDTPSRLAYCIGSAVAGLVLTLLFAVIALRRQPPGPHGRTLREEASQDLALLQEWRESR